MEINEIAVEVRKHGDWVPAQYRIVSCSFGEKGIVICRYEMQGENVVSIFILERTTSVLFLWLRKKKPA